MAQTARAMHAVVAPAPPRLPRVRGNAKVADNSTQGDAVPKFLVEVSYTQAGVKGVQSEGGSSRRDAVAQVA